MRGPLPCQACGRSVGPDDPCASVSTHETETVDGVVRRDVETVEVWCIHCVASGKGPAAGIA